MIKDTIWGGIVSGFGREQSSSFYLDEFFLFEINLHYSCHSENEHIERSVGIEVGKTDSFLMKLLVKQEIKLIIHNIACCLNIINSSLFSK